MKYCAVIDANPSTLEDCDNYSQMWPSESSVLNLSAFSFVVIACFFFLKLALCFKVSTYHIVCIEMIYFLQMGFNIKSGQFPISPIAVALP